MNPTCLAFLKLQLCHLNHQDCQALLRFFLPRWQSGNSPGRNTGQLQSLPYPLPFSQVMHWPECTVVQCLKHSLGFLCELKNLLFETGWAGFSVTCSSNSNGYSHPRGWGSYWAEHVLSLWTLKSHVKTMSKSWNKQSPVKIWKQHTALGGRCFKMTVYFYNGNGQRYRQGVWPQTRHVFVPHLDFCYCCFVLVW